MSINLNELNVPSLSTRAKVTIEPTAEDIAQTVPKPTTTSIPVEDQDVDLEDVFVKFRKTLRHYLITKEVLETLYHCTDTHTHQ